MRFLIFFLILMAMPLLAVAQFGFRGNYVLPNNLEVGLKGSMEEQAAFEPLMDPGFQLGLDYWFRLKKTRIEFFPTLYFSQFSKDVFSQDHFGEFRFQQIGFRWNTHIYLLDINGDCDCPTWSNSEPVIEKGFFLHLAPQVARSNGTYKLLGEDRTMDGAISLGFSAGVGLDIGLTKQISITPILSYFFLSDVSPLAFDQGAGGAFPEHLWPLNRESGNPSFQGLELGLRLGFRLDQ